MIFKKLIICLFFFTHISCKQNSMKTIYRLSEINLTALPPRSLVLVDIDDTIITPESKVFHHQSQYKTMIDEIKQKRDQLANFSKIISNWRLQRKPMLVDPLWLEKLRTCSAPVYALTQMETGQIGNIPSMQQWRHEELSSLGINFTLTYNQQEDIRFLEDDNKQYQAVFYKGFFITGSFKKGELLEKIIQEQKLQKIVFIDDREDHVKAIMAVAEKARIECEAILYRGVELIPGSPDPEVAAYQQATLIKEARWLEDHAAAEELGRSTARTE